MLHKCNFLLVWDNHLYRQHTKKTKEICKAKRLSAWWWWKQNERTIKTIYANADSVSFVIFTKLFHLVAAQDPRASIYRIRYIINCFQIILNGTDKKWIFCCDFSLRKQNNAFLVQLFWIMSCSCMINWFLFLCIVIIYLVLSHYFLLVKVIKALHIGVKRKG